MCKELIPKYTDFRNHWTTINFGANLIYGAFDFAVILINLFNLIGCLAQRILFVICQNLAKPKDYSIYESLIKNSPNCRIVWNFFCELSYPIRCLQP